MKKQRLCITTLLLINLMFSLNFLSSWTDSDYWKYNYRTFYIIPKVNRVIDPQKPDLALLNAAVFYETNLERMRHNIAPFIHSPRLEKAALGHSKDMVRLNFISHYSRIRKKRSFFTRIKQAGIYDWYIAENIAYFRNATYMTYGQVAKKLLKQWMRSPGHKKIILSGRYNYLGCGVALKFSPGSRIYKATQNFCQKDSDHRFSDNPAKRKKILINYWGQWRPGTIICKRGKWYLTNYDGQPKWGEWKKAKSIYFSRKVQVRYKKKRQFAIVLKITSNKYYVHLRNGSKIWVSEKWIILKK